MENYRKCFIPWCYNDTKNSNKTIVRIREDLRAQWCREVNVEYFKVYTQYCCEDHFDPKQDLKNPYFKSEEIEPRFKPTAKLRNVTFNARNEIEDNKEIGEISSRSQIHGSELANLLLSSHPVQQTRKRQYEYFDTPNTSCAISSQPLKAQAAVQASVIMADKATNTSFKSSKFSIIHLTAEQSSSTPASESPSLFNHTAESEGSEKAHKNGFELRKNTLDKIYNRPKMYLGLSKQNIWLVDFIVEKSLSKIDSLCIIAILLKIKQNDTIERLSDELEISRAELSTMIHKGIKSLSNFFQNFIFSPPPNAIKINLALISNIRYANVKMIIDCFEIQIAKPSNTLMQAQTWSQYKNYHTVKYLIGCTPDGLISFISHGYGGRISDKAIVEQSSLLDVLQTNDVVLADRGFKEIEFLLRSRGIKLLRPPSVYSGAQKTAAETMQTKVIASSRVHIDRVIRLIMEFSILKPHSEVNYEYVANFDEIVTIACGLINLQGEIIE